MRIVHVVDTFAPLMGGIEAQVARLAARQAAAGHDVEVITTTPAAPGERGVTTSVERLGSVGSGGSGGGTADPDLVAPSVTVHRIAARVPGGWPIHPRSTAHVVRRLRELTASGARPDVVHLHMGVLAPTVQAALRPVTRLGLPAVLTVHSVWGRAWRAFAAADAATGWSRWPVLWSAVSELTAAPLRRIVGTRGEVRVLPNGLDLAEWRAERRRDAAGVGGPGSAETGSAEAGSAGTGGAAMATGGAVAGAARAGAWGERSPAGDLHVVSAARFAPRKRMLPLLAAVARAYEVLSGSGREGPAPEAGSAVPGRGRDGSASPEGDALGSDRRDRRPGADPGGAGRLLRVTLAGDGAELGRARRFVAERGLSGVVSLPGALGADDLRALYADADVFAAPAVAEAFGIAALEAQSAGLPVLTRGRSGVAERVSDGVDGLVVPDDEALARALVRLATDHDLLYGLRTGSRDDARLSAYDWPGVLTETEKAYARAAELAGTR